MRIDFTFMRQSVIMLALLAVVVPAAKAQQPTVAAPSQQWLYQRLDSLEAEVATLKRQQAAGLYNTAAPNQPDAALPGGGSAGPMRLPDPTPEPCCVAYPTFKVTGFFQLDGAWFNQDQANRDTVGDVNDGLTFRRARLAATGKVADDTTYMLEFDFAQAQARFVDVWMTFSDVPLLGNLRIGRWRQPFGMSELTGIRELPFLERPLTFAFAPFRQTGIGFYDHSEGERLTWAASAYRFFSDDFGNVYSDNGGYGTSIRGTALALYFDDDALLHLGVDYSFNDPGGDVVQYASQPEVFVGQNPDLGGAGLNSLPLVGVPAFVNTGPISAKNSSLFNIEAAAKYGAFYIGSEARWALVKALDGRTDVYSGTYVQARYLLTGETLPYKKTAGVFGRVKPLTDFDWGCCGWGAWELAARWSYIDLNGQLSSPGRHLHDLTFGVNWYWNDHTKFQFNYIHAFLDDITIGKSDADIVALRAQVDF